MKHVDFISSKMGRDKLRIPGSHSDLAAGLILHSIGLLLRFMVIPDCKQ